MSTVTNANASFISMKRYGRSNTFKKIFNEQNMTKKRQLISNAKLHFENKKQNPGWFTDVKNQEKKLDNIKKLEQYYSKKVGGKTRKRRTVRRTRKH
jgi:hypothetical protein